MKNITRGFYERILYNRRAVYAFCSVLLTLSIALISVLGFFVSAKEVRNEVLRLHVIANSDSDEDQAVKLLVRDKVLETGFGIFDGSVTADDAENRIKPELGKIEDTAKRVLSENGFSYGVRAELVNEYFDERAYGDITLPSGNYEAVRIILGEGKGQNWWCVMFPPLCLPAVTEKAENGVNVFSDEQRCVVEKSPHYEIRFKLAEFFEKLFCGKRR